jgi:NADPH oxidase
LLAALEEEDIDHFLEIHAYVTGGMKVEEIRNITLNDEAGVKDALTGLRSPTHYGRPNVRVFVFFFFFSRGCPFSAFHLKC